MSLPRDTERDPHADALLTSALSEANAVAAAVGVALHECLENVRRHAGVLAADVTVLSEGDTTSVIVVDEGAGFDPALVSEDRLGLRDTVHEALRIVGGQATVWSGVGRGTSVLLSVPVGSVLGPVRQ